MAIGFKTRKAALALNPKPAFGLTSAADPVLLPKPKPRALREHFVVPSIRNRDGACTQRSGFRQREAALKALDFGNGLLGVHSVPLSNMGMVIVNGTASAHLHSGPLEPFP